MGSIGKVILRIDESYKDKVILMILSISMKVCLTLDHKGNAMIPYGLIVLDVVRDMRVGFYRVEMVVMGVVRVAT